MEGVIINIEWQKKHSSFGELCSLPSLFKTQHYEQCGITGKAFFCKSYSYTGKFFQMWHGLSLSPRVLHMSCSKHCCSKAHFFLPLLSFCKTCRTPSTSAAAVWNPESQLKWRWFRAKPGALSWSGQGETTLPLRALLRGTHFLFGWQLGMVMPWTATARCQSSCVKTPVVCKRMGSTFSFWLLESHDGQCLCW